MSLTKDEFYVLSDLYSGSLGRASCPADRERSRARHDPAVLRSLIGRGLVEAESLTLTEAGREELAPYRVKNAVILAAGASPRFIPLSLEKPKGLLEVKGEKLIERQIQQLQAAGIRDIVLVLGYKKEMFYYLAEKYGVRFVINDAFNVKNNIESLWRVREEIGASYICVSDSYFTENPFHEFEYESFYAGMTVDSPTGETFADTDEEGRIVRLARERDGGKMIYGHSYWQPDFARDFFRLVEADRSVGKYNNLFWEWMLMECLDEVDAPLYFREFDPDTIYEFDSFEDLRKFDPQYLAHSHSEIIRNIKLLFRCDEEDVVDFRNVKGGLTNTSFIFKIDGTDYIYRHPGDGTESIINRRNEKNTLILAKQLGLDPTYIYMDVNEGWKVSEFVHGYRKPDYADFEDSKKVLAVLRRLHSADVTVDYGLRPWEDALEMEKLLRGKDPACFRMHESLKEKVGRLYAMTVGDGVERCMCHGDTYKPNWMFKPDGEVYLIDWEYSGMSDPGVDVGYYIVDAMYDFETAERFVREYLGADYTEQKRFHFMAYVAIIAYYWFVWALYRESCGASMGESLVNWRLMAEKYVDYMLGE